MENELEHSRENMALGMMGQRVRAGHAKQMPIGDKMINAVRDVIWEAWEQGRDQGGGIYPSVPLLEQLTQPAHEPER